MKKKMLILPLIACSLFACKQNATYNINDYIIEIPYQDNFKVLQLTDTHWLGTDDWEKEGFYNFIKDVVEQAQPNFIVITGDLINNGTLKNWQTYCDFFDSLQIPWTLTFGNHDARCYLSLEELTTYLNQRSKTTNSFLRFNNQLNDSISGNANFAINLTNDKKVIHQLIIMDSNRYQNEEYAGDNYIQYDQINWYKDLVNYTTTNNDNKVVPSYVFFHIPLVEYLDAAEAVIRGELKFDDEGKDSGQVREKVCCGSKNNGFFTIMKDLKSTKATFVGHDHVNNYAVDYQGIKLCYGLKSSDSHDTYSDDDMLGGRLIALKSDGTFETSLVHYTKESK